MSSRRVYEVNLAGDRWIVTLQGSSMILFSDESKDGAVLKAIATAKSSMPSAVRVYNEQARLEEERMYPRSSPSGSGDTVFSG